MVSGVNVLTRQTEALLSRQCFESRQTLNKANMPNTKEMQPMIMQAPIETAMVELRAMGKTYLPAEPHTRRSIPEEQHRP